MSSARHAHIPHTRNRHIHIYPKRRYFASSLSLVYLTFSGCVFFLLTVLVLINKMSGIEQHFLSFMFGQKCQNKRTFRWMSNKRYLLLETHTYLSLSLFVVFIFVVANIRITLLAMLFANLSNSILSWVSSVAVSPKAEFQMLEHKPCILSPLFNVFFTYLPVHPFSLEFILSTT